jgi:beta-1,4-mannosyltransferase
VSGEPVRVLQSFPRPRRTTNPYLSQLLSAMPPDVDVSTFGWRTALTGRYDVLHVHWPEVMLRGSSRLRTAVRQVRFAALLLRVTARRTALVRTLHNTQPHEAPSAVERALLAWVERRTTLWIRLNPLTPAPTDAPVVTVLHGHYRDWYAPHPREQASPGRYLFFGLVRPYKGVEALLAAFERLRADDVTLRIVGKPTSADLADAITRAAASEQRIGAHLDYVDEDVLAREISGAELVVLPYRELGNSGAALLALSLDRPVLVPDGPVVADLAREVGDGWVFTFDGELDEHDLTRALARAREPRVPRPDLSRREWSDAGARHAEAYRAAVDRVRRPTTSPEDR